MSDFQPVLLPTNRKLRHLRGIYVRNLTFQAPKGITNDDTAISRTAAATLPKKQAKLGHAWSSDDLKRNIKEKKKWDGEGGHSTAEPVVETRHEGLQRMLGERLGDLFFSVEVEGQEGPVYISEIIEKRLNFNFQFFDLQNQLAIISRSPTCTINLYSRRGSTPDWTHLLSDTVDLRHLSPLPSLQNQHFPHNALIFHLTDGTMYTFGATPSLLPRPQTHPLIPTSSYHALMKLGTLESSIHDAEETQWALSDQISTILSANPPNPLPLARERTDLAQSYLLQQRRIIHTLQRKKANLTASITVRRTAMASGYEAQGRTQETLDAAVPRLAHSKSLLAITRNDIRGQRRRICADLADIFKIEQIPNGVPLSFQIRGIPLPNSVFDASMARKGHENEVSAALGMAAHLVDLLQVYLAVPLPYPVHPFGSRASISDEISLLPEATGPKTRNRKFPLWLPPGGSTALQFRFDYAWFLLNKDIETMCTSQGLRIVDIRHTLPNLQYLLYVLSAGTDEMPERKRGGIRGLWSGRRAESSASLGDLNMSDGSETPRWGSWDFGMLERRDLRRDAFRNTRKVVEEEEEWEGGEEGTGQGGDHGEQVVGSLGSEGGFVLPFRERRVSLRTKGMKNRG